MLAEGELRSNLDDSDRVRDLQDKVADLKAEVSLTVFFFYWLYRFAPNYNGKSAGTIKNTH